MSQATSAPANARRAVRPAASRPTTSAASQPASRPVRPHLPIGSIAPKFEATALSGAYVRFPDDFAGQLVLLHVWASWCPSCAKDFPFWIKARDQFGDSGLSLLGIATDVNHNIGPGQVQSTFTQRGGTWDVIYEDSDNTKILSQILAPALPTLYLVDGDTGVIIDAGDDLRRGRILKTLERHMAARFPSRFPTSQATSAPASQPGSTTHSDADAHPAPTSQAALHQP
jgi:thiol-disulfide isomerase/thioredoxin